MSDIVQFGKVDKSEVDLARKFCPWASRGGLTDTEVVMVISRCNTWGLNPTDAKSVTVVKDKHGIRIEPGYRVMIRWLDNMGNHSAIETVRLVGDALEAEGVTNPQDIVYKASVIMIDKLISLTSSGISEENAIKMATYSGIGRVSAGEYMQGNSERAYAAANGRTPAFKAKKRAIIDMVSQMGGPTDVEIRNASTMDRGVALEARHFEGTHALADGDALALATARATREQMPALTTDEANEAATALFSEAPQIIDAEPMPEPQPAPVATSTEPLPQSPRPWQPEQVLEFITETAAADTRPELDEEQMKKLQLLVVRKLRSVFGDDNDNDHALRAIIQYLTGKATVATLTRAQLSALARWLVDKSAATKDDPNPVAPHATEEAYAIFYLVADE